MSTMNKNYFFLSQGLYGQRLIIKINNQGFCYNHDEIVDANKESFSEGGSANRSWSEYGCYSKTNGYPGWAKEHIKKI
ncbi:hypothetical protein [uncultured Polaribacter sp.]|uniref:hypothetical protein n=1 Tax=uncultured Polaribacter sp. TaxID=174711 RepID=UPI0026372171|nr:hypothetical protein [uncultured Polaribacter sp.]